LEQGFDNSICQKIREILYTLLEEARTLPAGGFERDRLISEIESFENIYIEWNNIGGKDEYASRQRGDFLKKLQKQRYKISGFIRKSQAEFHSLLDAQLIRAVYKKIGVVASEHSQLLPAFRRAYAKYTARTSHKLP
jgi:hypothetical protein